MHVYVCMYAYVCVSTYACVCIHFLIYNKLVLLNSCYSFTDSGQVEQSNLTQVTMDDDAACTISW